MLFTTLALIVAAIHIYIAVLEMKFWDQPRGLRVFGLSQELATQTKTLAFNQGLYNGFLAAGIIVGIAAGVPQLTVFIVICVLVAGLVGFATGIKSALYAQSIPAALALLAMAIGL
jgi:putative membrane protein